MQSPVLESIDTSRVTRIWRELDEAAERFRQRPLGGAGPCVWLDALHVKIRPNHRLVNMARTMAVGVTETGERQNLGVAVGDSEEESSRKALPDRQVERVLRGVELLITNAHRGLQNAIPVALVGAAWQRRIPP